LVEKISALTGAPKPTEAVIVATKTARILA